jgi:hypothetical protein
MTLKNKKAKGTMFEHRVRDLFKSKGFSVLRQASSAFPDLVVVCDRFRKEVNGYTFYGDILFVECKVNGNLSEGEILHFKHIKDIYNVRTFYAYPLGSAYDVKSENIILRELLKDGDKEDEERDKED